MTTTLDPRASSTRAKQPGDDFAHIALATDSGLSITGRALCGYHLGDQRAGPLGDRQLCVVCEDLARGAWTDT